MRVPLEDPAAVLDRLRGGADAQAGAQGILRESDWSAWPALISTRLIPHLSRMTSETEGVATENDRRLNPQVIVPFRLRRWSQTRPGPLSQGGDTGSIPFGTAQVGGTCELRVSTSCTSR